MAYDSELQISYAAKRIDDLQDKLQALYDSLSTAVTNGRHGQNVPALESASVELSLMQGTAQIILDNVKWQIQDVLSAEKQFLEEVD